MGDWETMAVKAEVWVEAVTKGGRRFMAAWKTRPDIARRRERQRDWESCNRTRKRRVLRSETSPGEERGNETGKVAIAHGSVEFCEATPIGLADES